LRFPRPEAFERKLRGDGQKKNSKTTKKFNTGGGESRRLYKEERQTLLVGTEKPKKAPANTTRVKCGGKTVHRKKTPHNNHIRMKESQIEGVGLLEKDRRGVKKGITLTSPPARKKLGRTQSGAKMTGEIQLGKKSRLGGLIRWQD